ncbi:MAG TPA: homoserine kinase [Burkholderiaceae bacterium]|nr:homoserine kinase [Burkholderiaceae bacterium]
MAVFTPVTPEQAAAWLARYDLGELTGFQGIASGIENTNYFVTTTGGRYVLTLFERLDADHLPFYLGLMKHLARHGAACPAPVSDRSAAMVGSLCGKPAAIVTRLPGRANMSPGAVHCEQIGALLARMHLAAAGYPADQPNLRALPWWEEAAAAVMPFLDAGQAALLADELAAQRQMHAGDAYRSLPRSAVHADLFRDNALFDGDRLGGAIDFYFAGVDTWLFDLAVTCNDWCIDDATGAFDEPRLSALLAAYRRLRPLQAAETALWPLMLRAAALRFWLSRLYDLHLPRPAEMVTPKQPEHFERILRERRRFAPALAAVGG